MKRSSFFIPLVALAIGSFSASAQTLYVPSGTNGIGSSSTTNVGIGTSAPDAPLTFNSVTGEKIHLYSSGSSLYGLSVYSNELRVISGAGGSITFGNQGAGAFSEYARITSSGALGLGMTPQATLDVAGNGIATFRAGVSTNAANTVAQIRSSLAVVGSGSTAQSVNGAVAYDYYNAGSSPSFSGTLLVYNGKDDPNTNYDLPQARRGSLIFQNVSAGLIATNGGSIYFAPASHTQMVIKPGGNVGIGTMNPDAMLAVNGTIHAKEVIVDTSSSAWSDYVFSSAYRLAPLAEVEQHIKSEGHLPGIPSAAQVAEHGVNMGEMQARLLAKVEELTLYMIELKKENAELRRAIMASKTDLQR